MMITLATLRLYCCVIVFAVGGLLAAIGISGNLFRAIFFFTAATAFFIAEQERTRRRRNRKA